jgi:hypothetical protein
MFQSLWLLLSSAHYHIVYLIIKLIWIICSYSLKIVPSLLGLSLTLSPCFINSQHPCYLLNTNTRPMFCCTPWTPVFVFLPPTWERFLTPTYATKVLKLWFTNFLLKKRINQPILYFKTQNNPPHPVRIHQPLL